MMTYNQHLKTIVKIYYNISYFNIIKRYTGNGPVRRILTNLTPNKIGNALTNPTNDSTNQSTIENHVENNSTTNTTLENSSDKISFIKKKTSWLEEAINKTGETASVVTGSLSRQFRVYNPIAPVPRKPILYVFPEKLIPEKSLNPNPNVLHANHPYILQNKFGIRYHMQLYNDKACTSVYPDMKPIMEKTITIMRTNSHGFTHTCHLTLQIIYPKPCFNIKDIITYLDSNIEIIDLMFDNQNKIDGSTFYSVLQADYLSKNYFSFRKLDTVVVAQPPKTNVTVQDLNPHLRKMLTLSKDLTGNTFCDHVLNEHPYDSKDVTSPAIGKNHIVFMSVDELNSNKLNSYFNNLKNYLLTESTKELSQQQDKHKELVFAQQHYDYMYNKLIALQKETNLTNLQKLEIWNNTVFESLANRPPLVKFGMLIPSNSEIYNPDSTTKELLGNIPLPLTKRFTQSDVKPAIEQQIGTFDFERVEELKSRMAIQYKTDDIFVD